MPIRSLILLISPESTLLSQWIYLFWTLHINGIIHIWSFISWLISFSMFAGSSMLQHASVLPSLLMAENCSFVWLYHIQFIHLSVVDIGLFSHFFVYYGNAETNIYVWFCRHVFISLGYIMSRKIAGSYGNSMLNFLRNCQSFPKQLHRFKFTAATYEGSAILTNTCYCLSFFYSHPSRCKVISAFLIYFILNDCDIGAFFICLWSFVNFLAEKCLLRSFALSGWVICFLLLR